MPRVQTITTNFTAGEFSPRLRGRVDLEKYNSSAELLRNVIVLRQGGATIRPSLDFCGEVKTSANATRLIAFVYSRDDAFVLELGDLYLRIWTAAGLPVESSPGVPVEVVTPYTAAQVAELDFTQGGDTLLLFHRDVPPQRLRRFSATSWILDAVPFDPAPIYEAGHASATITLTLSAATVGAGRTVTASAAFFLAADVGRTITAGPGVLKITGFVSATEVTGDVSTAFAAVLQPASTWRLQGTPQTTVTPSAATPLGTSIDLTLTVSGWRNGDLGSYVEVNGGLLRLSNIISDLVATGVIEREITGTTAAPADAWVLKSGAFNVFDGYPRTGTLLQQRLWVGGTRAFPLSFWGSRSGLAFDFLPGTLDDSAVYKTVDSDENNVIQYLASGWGTLIALTYGNEFDVRGGIEKPITQLNAQITKRSRWGAALCRPEELGTDMAYVVRGARAVRVMEKSDIEGITSNEVSIFSEHLLADGIVSLSYEQTPESVLWHVTAAGALLALTYHREQTTASYSRCDTDGAVEWVATVPSGASDTTFALVRRTIGAVTKRYIERLNWAAPPGQDSRKQVSGAASNVWAGFDHLDGNTVAVLADDVHVGTAVVAAGSITLPRSATKVSAGLPYVATIRLQAPEVGTGTGTAQGQAMSTHEITARFLSTIGCKVNGQFVAFQQFDGSLLDVPPAAFSGLKRIGESGWELGESPLELTQDLPYPWTVLSIIRSLTVNQG
jgi:hypothetical protein